MTLALQEPSSLRTRAEETFACYESDGRVSAATALQPLFPTLLPIRFHSFGNIAAFFCWHKVASAPWFRIAVDMALDECNALINAFAPSMQLRNQAQQLLSIDPPILIDNGAPVTT